MIFTCQNENNSHLGHQLWIQLFLGSDIDIHMHQIGGKSAGRNDDLEVFDVSCSESFEV